MKLSFISIFVNDHKRKLNRDLTKILFFVKRFKMNFNLQIRRELWKWSTIENDFKRLFESYATFRISKQRNDLLLITRNRLELLMILFTRIEKNLLFVVFAQLFKIQIIIVVVFLIVLKQNFRRRYEQWKMFYDVYDFVFISYQLHAIFTLLLINIEIVVIENFVVFNQSLHVLNRLNRLILNEIYLLLIVVHYRR